MKQPRQWPWFVVAFALLACEAHDPGNSAQRTEVGAASQALGTAPAGECSVGLFQGSEYWFCKQNKSFAAARAQCQSAGLDLARIDSSSESAFVAANLTNDAWIGASDQSVEGAWRWADDVQFFNAQAGTAVGGLYNNWKTGEPNNWLNQDCAAMDSAAARWTDRSCADPIDFVCERQLDATEALVTCADSGPSGAPWPRFRRCATGQGQSAIAGSAIATPVAAFTTGGKVESSPAIGADGTVYAGSFDGYVYALRADLTLSWRFQTQGPVRSSPTIGPDGVIYVGSGDGRLYALNPNGTQRWSFATGAPVRSSPTLGPDGTIYVGSDNGKIYAITPSGSERWKIPTLSPVRSSPTVSPDGTIYVGSDDWQFFALNPDGSARWYFGAFGPVSSSPAIGPDGTVYVGSYDGHLYALHPGSGKVKWAHATGWAVTSSPGITPEGNIVFGDDSGRVRAVTPAGTLKWLAQTGGPVLSSAAVGSDGTVYIGSYDNKVFALNGETGAVRWTLTTGGDVVSSPAIGISGAVYVGSYDNKLYGIGRLPLLNVDQVGQRIESLTAALTPRKHDPAAFDDGTPAVDMEDAIETEVAWLIERLPPDGGLTPASDIVKEIKALGRALTALTVSYVRPLGLRTDGTRCPNVLVMQRSASGSYVTPPLTVHYDRVQNQSDVAHLQLTVQNLATMLEAIRCLNSRDLSLLEHGFVHAFLRLQRLLHEHGQHALANAFWDYTLPVALLFYDAVKYFQFPKTLWVLRMPDFRFATKPPLVTRLPDTPGTGSSYEAWMQLPGFEIAKANRYYCLQERQPHTLDRLGIWLEDVVNSGVLNRAPLLEGSSCEFLREITTVERLGAGDCSLLEMVYTRYQCRSGRTCEPARTFDPTAFPGTRLSAITQFGTRRTDVQNLLCNNDLGFVEMKVGAREVDLSHLFPLTSCATAASTTTWQQTQYLCNLGIYDGVQNQTLPRAIFWTHDDRVPGCDDPARQDEGEGDDDEEPPDDDGADGCTDENSSTACDNANDVTEEFDSELNRAGKDLNRSATSAHDALAGAVGQNGLQSGSRSGVIQSVNEVVGRVEGNSIHLLSGNLPGSTVGKAHPDGKTITLDIGQITAVALGEVNQQRADAGLGVLSLSDCQSNTGCSAALAAAISREIFATIRHELGHFVYDEMRSRSGIFTAQARHREKDRNCRNGTEPGCSTSHRFIEKWRKWQCAPDQPCGNPGCGHGNSRFQRFETCIAGGISQGIPGWCPGPADNPVACTELPSLFQCFATQRPDFWDQPVCQFTLCGPEQSEDSALPGQCCGTRFPDPLPPPLSCTGSPFDPCPCCEILGTECPEHCRPPCITCQSRVPGPD